MRRYPSRPLKASTSCTLANHPRNARISTDRPVVCAAAGGAFPRRPIPTVPKQVDARPPDPPASSSICRLANSARTAFRRWDIEEAHIRAIDRFALLCRRIRARNVEIPVLHEVVIFIAATGFCAGLQIARCSRSSRHCARHWTGLGFNLFDALFTIPRGSGRRHNENSATRRRSISNASPAGITNCILAAAAQQTVHAQNSPPIRSLLCCKMRVFTGKRARRCSKRRNSRPLCLSRRTLAMIAAQGHRTEFDRHLQGVLVMRSVKAIATLASVAAVACSIFAFSWGRPGAARL